MWYRRTTCTNNTDRLIRSYFGGMIKNAGTAGIRCSRGIHMLFSFPHQKRVFTWHITRFGKLIAPSLVRLTQNYWKIAFKTVGTRLLLKAVFHIDVRIRKCSSYCPYVETHFDSCCCYFYVSSKWHKNNGWNRLIFFKSGVHSIKNTALASPTLTQIRPCSW